MHPYLPLSHTRYALLVEPGVLQTTFIISSTSNSSSAADMANENAKSRLGSIIAQRLVNMWICTGRPHLHIGVHDLLVEFNGQT